MIQYETLFLLHCYPFYRCGKSSKLIASWVETDVNKVEHVVTVLSCIHAGYMSLTANYKFPQVTK